MYRIRIPLAGPGAGENQNEGINGYRERQNGGSAGLRKLVREFHRKGQERAD